MRAICTSASLQASTWVSPGFTLFRHSSPPFGSKQAHSNSTHMGPVGVEHSFVCTPMIPEGSPFQYERSTGNNIFSLARLFDSLVRVSRRGEASHFRRPDHESRRSKRLARRCHKLYLRSEIRIPILQTSWLARSAAPRGAALPKIRKK